MTIRGGHEDLTITTAPRSVSPTTDRGAAPFEAIRLVARRGLPVALLKGE